MRNDMRKGFTLIELLVVVAIIALLIGILLPALSRAKKAAWMAISMSNIKQINTGVASYKSDNDDFMPLMVNYFRGFEPDVPGVGNRRGWCTWSFGGKNNNGWWATAAGKKIFDVEAADRPLNPYVHGDVSFYAPEIPDRLAGDDIARERDQAPVFKDPSDKATRQRDWPEPDDTISSYDDVGSSYHFNAKWFYQFHGDFDKIFKLGTRQMRAADSFQPSRFVWVHDQTPDVVANGDEDTWIENGYGDINKGILGFLDGHGAYLKLEPGEFSGEGYTFLFDVLRIDDP